MLLNFLLLNLVEKFEVKKVKSLIIWQKKTCLN